MRTASEFPHDLVEDLLAASGCRLEGTAWAALEVRYGSDAKVEQMGAHSMDRADVRAVVHLAPPGSVEAYYQEVGRAGRDRQEAFGLLLHSPGDLPLRRRLLESGGGGEPPKPEVVEHKWGLFLDLMRWAESGSCRHDAILRYSGDEAETLAGRVQFLLRGLAPGQDQERRLGQESQAMRGIGSEALPLAGVPARSRTCCRPKSPRCSRRCAPCARSSPGPRTCPPTSSPATLRDIALLRPRGLEALHLAHGIGPAKAERYGARILEVVARAAPA